jgi:group I intron endonuclease
VKVLSYGDAPGIYAIMNLGRNQHYIGSARCLRERKNEHFSRLRRGVHENKRLQRSWNKYGEESFQFIVCDSDIPLEALLRYEQVWIDWTNPSFNLNRIASSVLGYRHTAETKAKMSAKARARKVQRPFPNWKGRKRPPFSMLHRLRLSEARQRRTTTEETKAKISASLIRYNAAKSR